MNKTGNAEPFHAKYRLGRRLGGGGMADVFRAEVTGAAGFSRHVAIKRLHATLSADQAFCAMFIREARLLSQLHHPNVVSVLDFEWDETGQLFLVMELVDGVNLAQLAESGRLPVHVAVYLVTEMLRGLGYAHERGIIHRDISPHNVLISWTGEVKLSDFGLARTTTGSRVSPAGGTIQGKARYLSPDQLHGLDLDSRTDLFSVGVILYELLTGRFPFVGMRLPPQTVAESIARMLTGTVVPPRDFRPEIPAELDELIMRLIERERDRRMYSTRDVLAVLDALPVSERVAALVPPLLAERFPELARQWQEEWAQPMSGMHGGAPKHERELTSAASELTSAASELTSAASESEAQREQAQREDAEAAQSSPAADNRPGQYDLPSSPGTSSDTSPGTSRDRRRGSLLDRPRWPHPALAVLVLFVCATILTGRDSGEPKHAGTQARLLTADAGVAAAQHAPKHGGQNDQGAHRGDAGVLLNVPGARAEAKGDAHGLGISQATPRVTGSMKATGLADLAGLMRPPAQQRRPAQPRQANEASTEPALPARAPEPGAPGPVAPVASQVSQMSQMSGVSGPSASRATPVSGPSPKAASKAFPEAGDSSVWDEVEPGAVLEAEVPLQQ